MAAMTHWSIVSRAMLRQVAEHYRSQGATVSIGPLERCGTARRIRVTYPEPDHVDPPDASTSAIVW